MSTNATVMYWMYNTVALMNHFRNIPNATAVVTGKPIENDGIPGRENATSNGLLIQLKEFIRIAKLKFKERPTMAIQGFGNVGGNVALLANEKKFNFKVIAVSDGKGGIYNPKGLNIPDAKAWYDTHGGFKGYARGGDHITNAELLALKTDILVPAAIENQITGANAHAITQKSSRKEQMKPSRPKRTKYLRNAASPPFRESQRTSAASLCHTLNGEGIAEIEGTLLTLKKNTPGWKWSSRKSCIRSSGMCTQKANRKNALCRRRRMLAMETIQTLLRKYSVNSWHL